MNKKKINRRKFLVKSLQCAAGLSFLVNCDKRSVLEPDVRLPSSPVGLDNDFTIENDQIKQVVLSWDPHKLTDINGAKLTTTQPDIQILGYNLFRTTDPFPPEKTAQPMNGIIPIAGTTFSDGSSFAENTSYFYWLEAIDSDNIISPLSAPLEVYITPPSPVYVAQNGNAVVSGSTLVKAEVKKTVDAAVMAVAQGMIGTLPPSIGNAYESIFGAVTSQSKIGIKINTLAASGANGLCTHVEVVTSIIEGLVTMLGNTFPANNIVVFDDRYDGGIMKQMIAAKFPLQNDGVSHRVASVNFNTTLHGVPANIKEPPSDLWADTYTITGKPIRLSSIIQGLDYIINVPVIKDHNIAGVTFSLKNFFGIIDNPSRLHPDKANDFVNDAVPLVYQLVANKVKLTIGDGFLGASQNGPATPPDPDWIPSQVIASTDPVATDAYVLKLINTQRAGHSRPLYSYSASGAARHILTAAKPPYKLGSINPKIIPVAV
jgi:uncharacterized protein (DUF362 family)